MFSLLSATLPLLGVAFYVLLLSYWLTGPLMIVWAQVRCALSGRVFFDKCARQGALLNFYLNVVFVLLFAYIILMLLPKDSLFFTEPYLSCAKFLGAGVAASFCLSLLHLALWKLLRQVKLPHILLGIAAAVAALFMVASGVTLLRAMLLSLPLYETQAAPESLADVLNVLTLVISPYAAASTTWSSTGLLIGQYLSAGLAAGGLWTGLWLLLRRRREDYGRDYYRFAISYTCAWAELGAFLAIFANLGLLAAMCGPEYIKGFLSAPLYVKVCAATFTLMALLSLLLWRKTGKSQNPLRNKPALIVAALIFWLAMPLSAGSSLFVMSNAAFFMPLPSDISDSIKQGQSKPDEDDSGHNPSSKDAERTLAE